MDGAEAHAAGASVLHAHAPSHARICLDHDASNADEGNRHGEEKQKCELKNFLFGPQERTQWLS